MDSEELMDKYRERLKKNIGRKIETTMIFPLSQFEAAFGHLWGHGKEDQDLTKEELVYKKKYIECRNNILNNGNQQRRNAFAELDMHDIKWNRYQTGFYPVGNLPEATGEQNV